MGQDIRDMLKGQKPEQPKLSDGHEMRLAKKMVQSLPKKKRKTNLFMAKNCCCYYCLFWVRIYYLSEF